MHVTQHAAHTTRYFTHNGTNVELIPTSDGRFLLCAEPPRYLSHQEVESRYCPAEDRRSRTSARRHNRGGGRRRRDRVAFEEDQLRAKTHDMVRFAELSLAKVRAWVNAEFPYATEW